MIDTDELNAAHGVAQASMRALEGPYRGDNIREWARANGFDPDDLAGFVNAYARAWLSRSSTVDEVASMFVAGIQLGWILCLRNAELDLDLG